MKKKKIALGVAATGLFIALVYNRNAAYTATIKALSESEKKKMVGVSWSDTCPITLDKLMAVNVRYRTPLGFSRRGTIIVNRDIAEDVSNIFRDLYAINFPIKQIRPIRKFGGHDPTSMKKNNTSAFRCSQLEIDAKNRRGSWSEHTKGEAIDVNPLLNPFVTRSGTVQPPEGEKYTDRSLSIKGMITPEVIEIFRQHGFKWGGNWRSSKDYQHFSIGGR